jgi:hypothetical protein
MKSGLTILFSLLFVLSCGDDDSSSPEESLCDLLGTIGGRPSIFPPCTEVSSTISGIQHDQFGRPVEFEFDIECTDGSGEYTGRIYNVTYSSLGEATSFDATINGRQCHWP